MHYFGCYKFHSYPKFDAAIPSGYSEYSLLFQARVASMYYLGCYTISSRDEMNASGDRHLFREPSTQRLSLHRN